MRTKVSKQLHKLKDDQGAAAVEFALLLLPLTLIIVGIMMFGIIFNAYLGITHTAREGVRWAALRAPFSGAGGVEEKARAAAGGLYDPDDPTKLTIKMIPASGATAADQGEPVTVSVKYELKDIKAMFGAFSDFLPTSIISSAVQRVE